MLPQKINLLIADPNTLTREGLKALLSKKTGVEIVGEASQMADLLPLLETEEPDILVIDYDVPGCFQIGDIADIRVKYPKTDIMVVTGNQNRDDILQILGLQVEVYLLKECDENELISALSACARGEKFFCGRIMDTILESAIRSVSAPQTETCNPIQLTEREVEVIRLIGNGNTTKDIATQLFLSFHTVTTHRKNIFKKLRIRTASELTVYAVQNGIIELE